MLIIQNKSLLKNKIYLVFILLLIVITSAQADVSVKDDHGRMVTLLQPAKRIISLAPHITESLFAAGAGNKIIGAVSYSDYPEAAKKIPRVGGYPTADIEKIISLKPDLIIAWPSGNNLKQVNKLAGLGFTIFMSEPHEPNDIAKTIKRFGILAGTNKIASIASEDFISHYERLKNNFSNKEKIKVFYQIWNRPLMTINGKHLISKIITLCGGVNVFSELKTLTPTVSIESVISSNAEVIISGGMGEQKNEWANEWKRWTQLPAVNKKHIYFINPDLLHRVGPRMLDGADILCDQLNRTRIKE